MAIYNASIPGRMATADIAPVTVQDREPWFRDFDPAHRPLWIWCATEQGDPLAWLSIRSFYGRPAYHATVEVAVYTSPGAQRQGLARALLEHSIAQAKTLKIKTLLAFIFGHNAPSLALFAGAGFQRWGHLPQVAELDGVDRDLVILGRRVTFQHP